MPWSRWVWLGTAAALFTLAFAMKVPLLEAPPYGDEHLHFVVAADPAQPTPDTVDVWGNPFGVSDSLFWQRPAFYAAFMAPAHAGFDATRIVHALVASVLAPLGAWLLRVHGVSWPACLLAGVALAITPAFVVWGTYLLMDTLMTVVLLAMLVARRLRRFGFVAVLATIAVWTKETAYAVVVVLFAIDLVRALRNGRASLYPLRLEPAEASLAWPLVLGPIPLVIALGKGLPAPGGAAEGSTLHLLQLVLPTVWVVPVLVVGLWWRRSRFLCAAGLAGAAAFLLLHAAGRGVQVWYAIPALAFAILGTASAADAAVRAARGSPWPRQAGAALAALLAVGVVLGAATLPHGPMREGLYPLSAMSPHPLLDMYEFETTLRDQDLERALADIPLQQHPDVLVMQNNWPLPFIPLRAAATLYVDLPYFRSMVGFDSDALAARIENATTYALLGGGNEPIQLAIREVYADCILATHGDWLVIQGAMCADRGEALRSAHLRHGGL